MGKQHQTRQCEHVCIIDIFAIIIYLNLNLVFNILEVKCCCCCSVSLNIIDALATP